MRAKSASLRSAGGSDPAGRGVPSSAPAADRAAIVADKAMTIIAAHLDVFISPTALSRLSPDDSMSLLSFTPTQQGIGFDCVRRFLHFDAAIVILVHLIEKKGRLAGAFPFIAAEIAVAVEVGGREIRRGEFPRARRALREVHGGPVTFAALARAGIGVLEACPIEVAGTFAVEGYALGRAAAAVRFQGDRSTGRRHFRDDAEQGPGQASYHEQGGARCKRNDFCFYVHR